MTASANMHQPNISSLTAWQYSENEVRQYAKAGWTIKLRNYDVPFPQQPRPEELISRCCWVLGAQPHCLP